jgi:bacterioferritin (cytochrome b1)
MEIGYLPCRILKAISYGKLGMTDCKAVKEILKEHVVYEADMFELLKRSISERTDIERIKKAMKYVEEHHTYVQRVRDMMRALLR